MGTLSVRTLKECRQTPSTLLLQEPGAAKAPAEAMLSQGSASLSQQPPPCPALPMGHCGADQPCPQPCCGPGAHSIQYSARRLPDWLKERSLSSCSCFLVPGLNSTRQLQEALATSTYLPRLEGCPSTAEARVGFVQARVALPPPPCATRSATPRQAACTPLSPVTTAPSAGGTSASSGTAPTSCSGTPPRHRYHQRG